MNKLNEFRSFHLIVVLQSLNLTTSRTVTMHCSSAKTRWKRAAAKAELQQREEKANRAASPRRRRVVTGKSKAGQRTHHVVGQSASLGFVEISLIW